MNETPPGPIPSYVALSTFDFSPVLPVPLLIANSITFLVTLFLEACSIAVANLKFAPGSGPPTKTKTLVL